MCIIRSAGSVPSRPRNPAPPDKDVENSDKTVRIVHSDNGDEIVVVSPDRQAPNYSGISNYDLDTLMSNRSLMLTHTRTPGRALNRSLVYPAQGSYNATGDARIFSVQDQSIRRRSRQGKAGFFSLDPISSYLSA